jgi:hypothetical protein
LLPSAEARLFPTTPSGDVGRRRERWGGGDGRRGIRVFSCRHEGQERGGRRGDKSTL